MKRLKFIKSFTKRWIQSWKTKPDFILGRKPLLTKQVSKKFSFLNAFISGALGVRTLLSILVGIAGITSIVVYDTVINPESPMFVGSSDSSGLETGNKELLSEISYLLSFQPESVSEPPIIETAAETAPEIIATEVAAVVEDEIVVAETSPPTGSKNNIATLFVLMGVSYFLAAGLYKLKFR